MTSRSSEAEILCADVPIFSFEEMSALYIHKGVPELFPIEEISALVYTPKSQPQDTRPKCCECFTARSKINNRPCVYFQMQYETFLRSFGS